jgi:hypothetical protein
MHSTVEQYLASDEGRSLSRDQQELVRRICDLYGVQPSAKVCNLTAAAVREVKKTHPP